MGRQPQVSSVDERMTTHHTQRAKAARRRTLQENLLAYLFLAPTIAVVVLVLFYPIIRIVITSFYSQPTYTRPSEFIGWQNYRAILNDPVFPEVVRHTIQWTIGVTIGQVCLGMYFALLLHQHFPFRGLARMLVIIPWVIPGIVVAVTWRFMYNQQMGLINEVLRAVGLGVYAKSWLGDPKTAMWAVIVVGVWKGFGFYMLMFLAGIQAIPSEIFESARIDGAGPLQQVRHITLPLLRPVMVTSTVLGLIWTSNYFEAIFILTGGGPARMTETFPMYIYNTAFAFYRFEKARAASNILLLLVLIGVGFYLLILSRRKQRIY
ncbi:MAG TPA: sugar ABC transporter permease [Aggregatilineaceae bacterium]|nr:sugar ABC transporter permease [Aggregatilineaceae bacterium]